MPAGRPTKYIPEMCEQATKLARLGAKDTEISEFFGIDQDTLYKWKKKHSEFSEALRQGKEESDANVSSRLYNRALGYEHDTEELLVVSDGAGQGSHVERVQTRKIYPPDVTACIFWLKNRQPKLWRDKQEIEHSGSIDLAGRIKEARERVKGK